MGPHDQAISGEAEKLEELENWFSLLTLSRPAGYYFA